MSPDGTERRKGLRPKSTLTHIYDVTHKVIRAHEGGNAMSNTNNNEPVIPTCLIHGVPMVLSFYLRPGGPPGNGWSCSLCAAERTQEMKSKSFETRNSATLRDFSEYCIEHPEERFWQALRNWSGAAFVLFIEDRGYHSGSSIVVENHDTFHREGK